MLTDNQTALVGAGIQSAGGIVGSIASVIGQKKAQKRQYNYQRQLMDYQSQLDQEQSTWNYLHSAELQKKGLRNAGISTALMNDGQAQSGNMSDVSAPSAPAYDPSASIMEGTQAAAQGVNTYIGMRKGLAEAEALEAEAKWRDKLLGKQYETADRELQRMKAIIPWEVEQARQTLYNMRAQQKLTLKQVQEVDKHIDEFTQIIRGLEIDNRWKDKLHDKTYQKLEKEVDSLIKDNKIKDVAVKLSEYGIIVNADGFTNFISSLLNGHGDKVMSALTNALGSMISQLPEAIGNIFTSVFDTIGSKIKPSFKYQNPQSTGEKLWNWYIDKHSPLSWFK